MKKSKFLLLGLIALMLAGGLVLASCKDKDDDACCKKSTFAFIESDDIGAMLAAMEKLPKCYLEKMEGLMELDDDATDAQVKAAAGCCYDALKAANAY